MAELLTKLEQARSAGTRNDIGNAIKGYEEIIRCKVSPTYRQANQTKMKPSRPRNRLFSIWQPSTRNRGKIILLTLVRLFDELIKLQQAILPLFKDMPKSKIGKIIRTLFDMTLKVDERALNLDALVNLCLYISKWCEEESRSFLRMRIESKLADIYFR